ncbi:DNA-binding transcriptional regulator, MarR family [Evansella caseinilytica]|uniref:DNA-binding transcriptional regulator, MarR family n=1 Tax=Evansella caseinilytica TaxID=1503961 RepID=A0A1H3IC16_9BACI|nr:DNA-binding transcriptional regulator, MarR family [Evansella caseinilytica]
MEHQQYIFGGLFILANKLQIHGDKFLAADGITLRQWLLTAVILQFNDGHPTLSEVANQMGTSHQNVRQLANKLQERGFLMIEKDEKDARAIRLKLTEKSVDFWKKKETENERFMKELFRDLNEQELDFIANGIHKLVNKIEHWPL